MAVKPGRGPGGGWPAATLSATWAPDPRHQPSTRQFQPLIALGGARGTLRTVPARSVQGALLSSVLTLVPRRGRRSRSWWSRGRQGRCRSADADDDVSETGWKSSVSATSSFRRPAPATRMPLVGPVKDRAALSSVLVGIGGEGMTGYTWATTAHLLRRKWGRRLADGTLERVAWDACTPGPGRVWMDGWMGTGKTGAPQRELWTGRGAGSLAKDDDDER
ncbi:hypothetical protein ACCO45_005912 [Purpureocillium lilacinum]|uniref:Uncharacterized protein n=1 Tax=Purpureocillium lilacinum TaxID=33203 RepID=A0ACC4DWR2_PURLI